MDSAIAHTRYLRQPRSARPRSKKDGAAIKQGEQGLARSQVPLRHSAAFLLKEIISTSSIQNKIVLELAEKHRLPSGNQTFFWLKHALSMEDLPLPCSMGRDGPRVFLARLKPLKTS